MRNLEWLYHDDDTFRNAVNQAAAEYIGSTNQNFAGFWLMEEHKHEHHDSDYEDLIGQHLDTPCVVPDAQLVQKTDELDSREKLEAELDNIISDALRNLRRAIYQCVEQRMDVLSFSDGEFIDFEHEEFVGEYVERAMKVLDRQAAITEREVLSHPDERDEQISELESIAAMHKRRCENLSAKLDYVLDERDQLQADADTWRAKCGALLDAAHEMVRIGGDAE